MIFLIGGMVFGSAFTVYLKKKILNLKKLQKIIGSILIKNKLLINCSTNSNM